MFNTGAEKIFHTHTVQPDFLTEAANIAALVFPKTEFQLLPQKIGSAHAALVLPKTQFQLLSSKVGSDNLSLNFKNKKHFADNFRLIFLPKIKTLIFSAHYLQGIAHLIYIPGNSFNWLDSRGYGINYPDGIGEKLEFLASKFYPFLEEFFLG